MKLRSTTLAFITGRMGEHWLTEILLDADIKYMSFANLVVMHMNPLTL